MKLSEKDAGLYFKLVSGLQLFVNKKLNVFPEITTSEDLSVASDEEILKLNQSLYDNIHLIDEYVKENPDRISESKLEIVSKWKNFVQDQFHIERFLKNYAVFISTSSEKVYGVLGLSEGFDKLIHKSRLPFLTDAVLLPFKGKIIYDGFLRSYNMYFGSGIKKRLKETYMRAKQNGRIIETLEEDEKQTKAAKPAQTEKNWKPELDEIVQIAKKLRGGSQQPPLYSPVFSVIKAAAELGQAAVKEDFDLDELWDKYSKASRALNRVHTILEYYEE